MDESRKQFEAWFKDRYSGLLEESYFKLVWVVALESWQASREAMEVEIDNHTEFEIEHMICPDKDGYSVGWIDGRNYAVKQVRAAGIKVKGE